MVTIMYRTVQTGLQNIYCTDLSKEFSVFKKCHTKLSKQQRLKKQIDVETAYFYKSNQKKINRNRNRGKMLYIIDFVKISQRAWWIKANRADAITLNETTVSCRNGMQLSRAVCSLADNKIAKTQRGESCKMFSPVTFIADLRKATSTVKVNVLKILTCSCLLMKSTELQE